MDDRGEQLDMIEDELRVGEEKLPQLVRQLQSEEVLLKDRKRCVTKAEEKMAAPIPGNFV